MHTEVEIKFEVADVAALHAALREHGFRLQTERTHEDNTLFDFPDQRLRKAGELLRLRKYGEQWVLTHKGPGESGGAHKSRVETETRVEDGERLRVLLHALGMAPVFRYEKFRTEYTDGTGHVVIDETPIGNMAEVEGPPEWIDRVAALLGVTREQYITRSYADLFFEWRRSVGSTAAEMTFAAVGKS